MMNVDRLPTMEHTSNSIVSEDGRVRFRFRSSLKRIESRRIASPVKKPTTTTTPTTVAPQPLTPQVQPATASSATDGPSVEIFPGFSARLRGAKETWQCIEEGYYTPVTCISCTLQICCILDADFVICPCCQGITAVREDDDNTTGQGGVGLGVTPENVQKHFAAQRAAEAASSTGAAAAARTTEQQQQQQQQAQATTAPPSPKAQRRAPGRTASVSLYDIFPPHIAEALRDGRQVEAEEKDCVTIFFSDIVGFTDISSTLPPRKIANMLDRLYSKLDDLTTEYDLYKIETIGDAFMAATNLVKDQTADHCKRVAQFALAAIQAANATLIDEDDPSKGYIHLRVGFHSGSVVADVVGQRNPRYCLFGDTVNVSSRMESNSEKDRINCSETSANLLRQQWPDVQLQDRGELTIKGKGEMRCFFVEAPAI